VVYENVLLGNEICGVSGLLDKAATREEAAS
jgi:hypothetical protein